LKGKTEKGKQTSGREILETENGCGEGGVKVRKSRGITGRWWGTRQVGVVVGVVMGEGERKERRTRNDACQESNRGGSRRHACKRGKHLWNPALGAQLPIARW